MCNNGAPFDFSYKKLQNIEGNFLIRPKECTIASSAQKYLHASHGKDISTYFKSSIYVFKRLKNNKKN